ncbi:uncharacterized protein LTR77_006692 [Saxophila tyrrhenica]|uniref:Uncharacterized protein n=1 Tax=Saxophila tyrrhenica TaxID=1690608 RepID=A0AAV9P5Z2_9PEZI|nr:hypothetical protein LTR77_006692 [Saxophila tyrrhenica]
MADGLNQARAMRVAEIMTDYRNIQTYIASVRANPSSEEYNEDGYVLLRRCVAEAQALLSQPFNAQTSSTGDDEQTKSQLRRIIIDASLRRFKVQRIYLRITAALRWINSRSTILQGNKPCARHVPALQQIGSALRTEVASVTDQRVELSLRSADVQQGKWLAEDPSLATLQRMGGGSGSGR